METRKLLLIVALAAMVVIGTGCDLWDSCKGKAVGGGWIEGKECGYKANIGFEVHKDGLCATGQVQYNDHSPQKGLMFHGVVEAVYYVSENTYKACGTGTLMPSKKCIAFEICVQDNGEPGNGDPADYVKVKVYDGWNCTYSNEGYLCGGNVQVMENED